MKEKIAEWTKKCITFLKRGNMKDKIKLSIAMLLLGIVFCIVGKIISSDKSVYRNQKTVETKGKSEIISENNNNLERRLEEIISAVDGVGNVKLLITYEDDGEDVPMENVNEKDSLDNERGSTDNSYEAEIVLEDNGEGESVAIRKKMHPSVRGVIVVAEGADDVGIKSELIAAVASVTGVSQHKIHVMCM